MKKSEEESKVIRINISRTKIVLPVLFIVSKY